MCFKSDGYYTEDRTSMYKCKCGENALWCVTEDSGADVYYCVECYRRGT